MNSPVNHDLESTPASAKKPSGIPVMLVVLSAIILVFIGLATIRGVTFQHRVNPDFYFYKQLICLGLAFIAAIATAFLPLEKLRRHAWIFAGVAVFLLAITLIPHIGWRINGSRRWLSLGNLRFQPSEFGKLALVFFLAHYLALNQSRATSFIRGFVIPFGITVLLPCLSPWNPTTAARCLFSSPACFCFSLAVRVPAISSPRFSPA